MCNANGMDESVIRLFNSFMNKTPKYFAFIEAPQPDKLLQYHDDYSINYLRFGIRELLINLQLDVTRVPDNFGGAEELFRKIWDINYFGEPEEQRNDNAKNWKRFIIDPVPSKRFDRENSDSIIEKNWSCYTNLKIKICKENILMEIPNLNNILFTDENDNKKKVETLYTIISLISLLIKCYLKQGEFKNVKNAIRILTEINQKVVYGALSEHINLQIGTLFKYDSEGENLFPFFTLFEQGLKLKNTAYQRTSDSIISHYYYQTYILLIQIILKEYLNNSMVEYADILPRLASSFIINMQSQMDVNNNQYKYRYYSTLALCTAVSKESHILERIMQNNNLENFSGNFYPSESENSCEPADQYKVVLGSFNMLINQIALYKNFGWYDYDKFNDALTKLRNKKIKLGSFEEETIKNLLNVFLGDHSDFQDIDFSKIKLSLL